MKLRVSAMIGLAAAAGAMSYSSLPAKEAPDVKSAERLARVLEGRTAGQPANCVPNLRGQARMEVIDDGTILFREGSTIYLQRPAGGCPGIKSRGYTLINRRAGQHQICQGDIQQLVDLQTGFQGGTCVFSDFVPYHRAR